MPFNTTVNYRFLEQPILQNGTQCNLTLLIIRPRAYTRAQYQMGKHALRLPPCFFWQTKKESRRLLTDYSCNPRATSASQLNLASSVFSLFNSFSPNSSRINRAFLHITWPKRRISRTLSLKVISFHTRKIRSLKIIDILHPFLRFCQIRQINRLLRVWIG